MTKRPLPPKQEAFCQEYANDPERNATRAYMRAGYVAGEEAARRNASRLLTSADIQARIAELLNPHVEKWEITRERVMEELAKIAFFNLGDAVHVTSQGDPYIDLSKLGEDGFAALAEVTVEDFMSGRGDDAREVRRVKIKPLSKLEALRLAGMTMALFKDKVEVTVRTDTAERLERARKRALARRAGGTILGGGGDKAAE